MEELSRAARLSIRMGEMSVTRNEDQLHTLLGSCIGLALYDQRRKIGGLAHIVLPSAPENVDQPGKFVDTAIRALIGKMEQLADGQLRLTAKIAGGASMFTTTVAGTIGPQNTESCQRQLSELGIPILAQHCGGSQGRRMSLHTANGKVFIKIVGQDPIEL